MERRIKEHLRGLQALYEPSLEFLSTVEALAALLFQGEGEGVQTTKQPWCNQSNHDPNEPKSSSNAP